MEGAFTLVDGLLLIVIALSLWAGWYRGFVLGLLDLLLLAASLLAALKAYPRLAALLEGQWSGLGVWAMPLAFVLAWGAVRLVLGALASAWVARLPRPVHTHPANRALGLVPGLGNGLIHATLLTLMLLTLPLSDSLTLQARDSPVAARLSVPAAWLEARLVPIFDPAVSRTLTRLTVRPESRESVPLPFRVTDPRVRPDLEARMLQLVNEERARQGRPPLRADPELAAVARAHAQDMFARGYFSHVSPEGHDPFDRMRQAQVRFLMAGENLALAPTLSMAHQGLMESPGHRANILRPAFGRVGIGVLDGGRRGLMVTQKFRN